MGVHSARAVRIFELTDDLSALQSAFGKEDRVRWGEVGQTLLQLNGRHAAQRGIASHVVAKKHATLGAPDESWRALTAESLGALGPSWTCRPGRTFRTLGPDRADWTWGTLLTLAAWLTFRTLRSSCDRTGCRQSRRSALPVVADANAVEFLRALVLLLAAVA